MLVFFGCTEVALTVADAVGLISAMILIFFLVLKNVCYYYLFQKYNAKEKVDKKISSSPFFSREVQVKDFFKLNKFLRNNLIINSK